MSTEQLREDLERATLYELAVEWATANNHLFSRLLYHPVFALSDSDAFLGRWVRTGRIIELSRKLVFEQPWNTVLEVLKHEMAHQFVDEVLRSPDPTAHGAAFASVCRDRGIDPRAAGLPEAHDDPQSDGAKIIGRVAKLLALAGSPNEHEAQAAMAAAQRLMLEHNLTQAASSAERRFISRIVGPVKGRREESATWIANVLSRHFFVQVVWIGLWVPAEGVRKVGLEVTGTPENVAMADYVYAFLDRTANSLWRDHQRARGLKSDRDRRAFRAGVMSGFLHKLDAARAPSAGTGLVWRGDAALQEHFRRRYPRVRRTSVNTSGDRAARAVGHQAGQRVILSRPMESGSGGGGSPKALGDGRDT